MRALTSIYSFKLLSSTVATAGQPTVEELEAIAQAGYQVVVNLVPPTADNAMPNEQQRVEAHGLQYVSIPVAWDHPTQADLTQFFAVMDANSGKKVFVHCAANKRVSVFMYLYRRLRQGLTEAAARPDLEEIWQPNPIWQQFIEHATFPTDS